MHGKPRGAAALGALEQGVTVEADAGEIFAHAVEEHVEVGAVGVLLAPHARDHDVVFDGVARLLRLGR